MRVVAILLTVVISLTTQVYAQNNSEMRIPVEIPLELKNAARTPFRLIIPKISVDAYIEHVGLDNEGKMDVPKNYENVAWYKFGSLPGDSGNTVIAGHYDTETGPAVFAKLNLVEIGDKIYLINYSETVKQYEVVEINVYSDEFFPLEKVFGPSVTPNLVLITCSGVFDSTSGAYSDRKVIFAKNI